MKVQRRADPLDADTVTVSVVIPVRNEVACIQETLDCVLAQTFDHQRTDIIVVDGLSTDGTRGVLEECARVNPRVRILDNPVGTIPVALNLGIALSDADVIVRIDGRCHIAPDYIERCVELLVRTGAGNVGGLVRPVGQGVVGEAIALAMRSRFGIGNSRYHYSDHEEFVDTVYMGAFPREVLKSLGGYDEALIRNQDDELNYRIRAAGYGILLSPSVVSRYTPPNSLKRLWRSQFYQYGLWKVKVILKHPGSLQPRHIVPPTLVAGLLTSVGSYIVFRRILLLVPVILYAGAISLASLLTAQRSVRMASLLPLVFGCMHIGYGTGFLVGICRAVRDEVRRHTAIRPSELRSNVLGNPD